MAKPTKKMIATERSVVRVAIYTRKSTEEGLDQEFNSLDAQRAAVEAYIESQRSDGLIALPDRYDDGGYSGGNTSRPGFQRLLLDIEAGKVDCVGVYKIDRLSRSLIDFVKTMDLFNRKGVTFVSVTQQFSTTNSMGKLLLNILVSFAEFERNVISDRTKDKIAASKKRGMWVGGWTPLGYDVVKKQLVVNAAEARQVVETFRLYLQLGSLRAVVAEMRERKWQTKTWTNRLGKVVPPTDFDKNILKRLLTNPVYVGRLPHKDEVYAAQHTAIVAEALFDEVQGLLQNKARAQYRPSRTKFDSLLGGLLKCGACGNAYLATYTFRHGRQYFYYECLKHQKEGKDACPRSHVPAPELDEHVVAHIRSIGSDPELVRMTVARARHAAKEKTPELAAQVRRLESDRRTIEAERKSHADALANAPRAGTDAHVARLNELDAALAANETAIAQARAELAAVESLVIDPAALKDALANFDVVWAELTPAERARLMALLVERITYNASSGDIEISFRPNGIRTLGDTAQAIPA